MKVNNNFDRNDAKRFTNIEFYLERSILKPTNLGEYYHIDLIGLKVYDANDNFIGVVEEITNNNNSHYLKLNFNNDFLFIPFTKKNINKIEMKSRKLLLN